MVDVCAKSQQSSLLNEQIFWLSMGDSCEGQYRTEMKRRIVGAILYLSSRYNLYINNYLKYKLGLTKKLNCCNVRTIESAWLSACARVAQ